MPSRKPLRCCEGCGADTRNDDGFCDWCRVPDKEEVERDDDDFGFRESED